MNVLYVTPGFPTRAHSSAYIHVGMRARTLRNAGIDLRVAALMVNVAWPFTMLNRYSFDPGPDVGEDPDWVIRQPVRLFPRALGVTVAARAWGRRWIRRLALAWPEFRPDLVYAHTFIPCAIMGEMLADKWRCPLVVSTHGSDTRDFMRRLSPRREILRLCGRADSVVCVGESIERCLTSHGASDHNLRVIYNGMDLSKVGDAPAELRSRYQGRLVVVGLGHLKHTKGFDLFIRAIAALKTDYPALHGIIVGGGAERDRLTKLAEDLGVSASVELVGQKSEREAMEYVAAGEIFCLPSWSEGFGIAYLEAMAHGKPVIGVEGQGMANIVAEHGTGLLAQPKSWRAVEDALKQLIDDSSLRRQMGERGRELVFREFSWEHCGANMLALFESLVPEKQGGIPALDERSAG